MWSVTVMVVESRVLRGTFGTVRAEQIGHGEELREWS